VSVQKNEERATLKHALTVRWMIPCMKRNVTNIV
jgi:hypothetical protein